MGIANIVSIVSSQMLHLRKRIWETNITAIYNGVSCGVMYSDLISQIIASEFDFYLVLYISGFLSNWIKAK